MIEKMTRYTFLLLSSEVEGFLSSIQELGLIDISRSSKPVDKKSAEMLSAAEQIRKNISRIDKNDYTRDAKYPVLLNERENAVQKITAKKVWGDVDSQMLSAIEDKGYKLRYYCVSHKKFNPLWEEEYPLQVISDDGKTTFFVTVDSRESTSFPLKECEVPQESLETLETNLSSIENEMKERIAAMDAEKDDIPSLKKQYNDALVELDKYLANCSSESATDNHIAIFTGFAPTTDDAHLEKELDKMDVYYYCDPATDEDNPPVKLRNNWFARNFEVLTGMYGMPVYGEFDPTPILAPFYTLFFAFCMGDAGYGLLLMLVALFLKKGSGGLAAAWRLVMTLGVGTLVIGLLFGTFFGVALVDVSWLPQGYRDIILTGKLKGTTYDLQMVIALAIGIFHVLLAMVVKAICSTKRFGFAESVSNWAWCLLFIGGLSVAALAIPGILNPTVTKWVIIVIGIVSALGIYVFNNPHRSKVKNVVLGLWDTYSMASGVFGDVLSYIRLYALGLAGGMLGAAFNNLAGMLLNMNVPVVNYLGFAIILAIGHALNLAMSALGAFVHPLRLTFVEYFKNSGYEGKGTGYKPLKK